ncbi:hypothetical protein IFM46972_10942 [Aspergillus udagawae]|uniref:Saponin hydrolase n=1 Tax=Aspergillus udagawae TaxID=91492 RepID=A0A8E0QRA8_9EURO|nr:uncharacterized protein Aud_003865 [Aspergillus udagawae]GFF57903.1 hypothetical protein IFM46972_10942 [Aspergillus udagawae]GIC87481.1 hypothetical protein Aud_003865 [Aspergillus udagawae]
MYTIISTALFLLFVPAKVIAGCPPAPQPEPITVVELPLPPVAPSDAQGSCVNPTGCIGQTDELRNGNFLPDNNHIVATVNFTGAPAGGIYSGLQLIVLRTNGTAFPNGDAWKCITCGVPESQKMGITEMLEYPQAFKDGRRVLVGSNIVDGGALLSSDECTPNSTWIYPIRWNIAADGSGEGGVIRELRIHPDNVHLGFNAYTTNSASIDEFAYFSRLSFNPKPTAGLPLVPRYDLHNVTRLFNPDAPPQIIVSGTTLTINYSAINVGEFRGFSGLGREMFYVGPVWESGNIDLFAVDQITGVVRRVTENPGYADPIDSSHDDKWIVILDTRSTHRTMFMDGMRHVPPLTDLVSVPASSSIRNNGARRFFEPWILNYGGDCGNYFGQQVNGQGDGSPGSINDPQWNAQADPRWSWDGTKIAYYQALTVSPACGGANPLPCPVSTAQGGRTYRIMLATLTSRTPQKMRLIEPVSDVVPWGVPYVAGTADPSRPSPKQGNYTLIGKLSGFAAVSLINRSSGDGLATVGVTYHNFSDDGFHYLSGNEQVTSTAISQTLSRFDWESNLTSTGATYSTKVTSPGGFHLSLDVLENEFDANGTLTTTVNGDIYFQPLNYT